MNVKNECQNSARFQRIDKPVRHPYRGKERSTNAPARRVRSDAPRGFAMAPSANVQQLINAIESMEEGVALFDADDRLVICNETYRGAFQSAAPVVVPGKTFETMIHAFAINGLVAGADGREEDWVAERLAKHRQPSSSLKQYLADGRCLQINEYQTQDGGRVAIQTDITDLERREASRQVTEERTRSIVETVIDGIITFDAEGTIETFNPAAETIFGYKPEEALGSGFSKLIGKAHRTEFGASIHRFLYEGDQTGLREIVNVTGERKDGAEFPLEIAIRELRGTWTLHERRKSQRHKFIATLRDISTRKRLAQQLQQAQKMEAIGTLAGGIAHDFNNILSIIMGYTSLVQEEVRGLDEGFRHVWNAADDNSTARDTIPASIAEVRENLDTVMQAGLRARDLVRQILMFSRHTEHEKSAVDLRPIVKEVMKLMRSTLPATIEFDQSIGQTDMVVLADPSQMHQVFMNLCANAGQAMDDRGGKLTVNLNKAHHDARALSKFGDLYPGPYVHLTVADDGYGMDEFTRERIFEPFFTTKELGKGTGLGLSVVHGIVNDHGGSIAVDSVLGEGTTFEVIVPVYESDEALTLEPEYGGVAAGRGRILFVDDEVHLVKMAQKVLGRLGYSVVGETRGQAALDRFRSDPSAFDLVITDQTMPEITGDILASEVRRLRGDVPIVLCTGHSNRLTPERAREVGVDHYVMKPLLIEELSNVVAQALDPQEKS